MWATPAEVLSVTGVEVEQDVVDQAHGVIEVFSGATDDDELSARNVRLLRLAVAYQAVWMVAQLDVLSRMDVSRLIQDGTEFNTAGRDTMVLAPLAQRCLAQLSWHGARSERVNRPQAFITLEEYADAWLWDGVGDERWRPL